MLKVIRIFTSQHSSIRFDDAVKKRYWCWLCCGGAQLCRYVVCGMYDNQNNVEIQEMDGEKEWPESITSNLEHYSGKSGSQCFTYSSVFDPLYSGCIAPAIQQYSLTGLDGPKSSKGLLDENRKICFFKSKTMKVWNKNGTK